MPDIPKWRRYLRFWRQDPERDVDDELRTHLELRVADLQQLGLTLAEARRQALAREAQQVALARHSLPALASATAEVYERALRPRRRASDAPAPASQVRT